MSGQETELVDLGGATVTLDSSLVTVGLASVGDVHVDSGSAIIQGSCNFVFLSFHCKINPITLKVDFFFFWF